MEKQLSEMVVSVRGLRMAYDEIETVHGLDLDLRRGEVLAILGPNGAGKTTTVEILEGFRQRSGGEVAVLGEDPARAGAAWRARIGVVLQESQPEPELRVRECLALYAGYYPRPRPLDETLALVGLSEKSGALCGQLSGGQRRRLDVALALIGGPELLFLDEPTTGFDPAARRASWEVIAGLRRLGTSIILTTHYMDEAQALADRIVVIAAGRVVAEGTPASIGGRDVAAALIAFTLPAGLAVEDLPAGIAARATTTADGQVRISTPCPLPLLGSLAAWAAARGVDLPDLSVRRPTLEEVYLHLTTEAHREPVAAGADRA